MRSHSLELLHECYTFISVHAAESGMVPQAPQPPQPGRLGHLSPLSPGASVTSVPSARSEPQAGRFPVPGSRQPVNGCSLLPQPPSRGDRAGPARRSRPWQPGTGDTGAGCSRPGGATCRPRERGQRPGQGGGWKTPKFHPKKVHILHMTSIQLTGEKTTYLLPLPAQLRGIHFPDGSRIKEDGLIFSRSLPRLGRFLMYLLAK